MNAIKITNTSGNTVLINTEYIVSLEDVGSITVIHTTSGRIDADMLLEGVVALIENLIIFQ